MATSQMPSVIGMGRRRDLLIPETLIKSVFIRPVMGKPTLPVGGFKKIPPIPEKSQPSREKYPPVCKKPAKNPAKKNAWLIWTGPPYPILNWQIRAGEGFPGGK
ncbi:MAG: hypothetical protein VW268_08960 [Rhodospirillaceae bacterium]